jgi:hypothetical protein
MREARYEDGEKGGECHALCPGTSSSALASMTTAFWRVFVQDRFTFQTGLQRGFVREKDKGFMNIKERAGERV